MESIASRSSNIRKILTNFISNEIHRIGMKSAVLGLSGGVDSSLVAYLAAEALGPEHVVGLVMPYRQSAPESLADANLVVSQLGIRTDEVDITPMADAYLERYASQASPLRRGNVLARMRMICLYDRSVVENGLVLGTSNKTELLLGYGTLYGDLASGINPLGDLYKTRVKELAKEVGVDERIVAKAPSADLWPDQTDEADLGFTYEDVDKLLYLLVDMRYDHKSLLEEGFDAAFIDHVYSIVQRTQYKRRLPLIAKVSGRTVDREFRYSRDWGV